MLIRLKLFLRDIRKDDIADIIKDEIFAANQQLRVKLTDVDVTIAASDDVPPTPTTAKLSLTEHRTIRP